MNHALYIAAAGLRARATALDVSANNLANFSTYGYKKDSVYFDTFNQVLQASLDRQETETSDAVVAHRTEIDFTQGPLVGTGNPLDVALSGDGFFAVQTAQGVRYTRNGNFMLGPGRELLTFSGLPVLGQAGPLQLPEGEISISRGGEINVAGIQAGRLQVVDFEDRAQLRKESGILFLATAGAQQKTPNSSLAVRQGFLEKSNMDLNEGLGTILSSMRSFEMLTRVVEGLTNDVDRTVIDDVGTV